MTKTCAPPDPSPRIPAFKMPSGSVDTHYHIFSKPSEFAANRSYTPPNASAADYAHLQSVLGIEKSVVIQPSIYGADNRTTLGHAAASPNRRAIGVVQQMPSAADLKSMAAQNCVGLRINAVFKGAPEFDLVPKLAAAIADLGWHLQFLIDVAQADDVLDHLVDLPVPIVIDHMGHVPARNGFETSGFQRMLALLGQGRLWVKLSAPYRLEDATPDYPATTAIARALVAANPDNLLWGTDWPHPAFAGTMPNDGDLVDLIPHWMPDKQTQQKILVDNPTRLYRF
ncbi:MAG: amidohydrolase family protein [Pseudomonadota bacterium]